MSQDRLGGLALLFIEKEAASNIDYSDLITNFAARKRDGFRVSNAIMMG
jgi:hypothetical protein